MATNYSFLNPGESILMEGNANMQQVLGINKGGKLILTNQRLVFLAHAFNVGSKFDEIPLSSIAMSGNSFNLFVPTPNMIKVVTTDGSQYQFVVTKKQRDVWVQQICGAASQFRSTYAYGSGTSNNRYGANNYSAGNTAAQSQATYGPEYGQYGYEQPNYEPPKKKKKTVPKVIGILLLAIGLFMVVKDGLGGCNNSEEWFADSAYSQEDYSSETTTEAPTTTTTTTTTAAPETFVSANKLVVPCNNDSGAIFDLTLDKFTEKYNRMVQEVAYYELAGDMDEAALEDVVSYYSLDAYGWEYVDTASEDNSGFSFDTYMNRSAASSNVVLAVSCERVTGRLLNVKVFADIDSYFSGENKDNNVTAFRYIVSFVNSALNDTAIEETGDIGTNIVLHLDNEGAQGKSIYYNNIIMSSAAFSTETTYTISFSAASDSFIDKCRDFIVPFQP